MRKLWLRYIFQKYKDLFKNYFLVYKLIPSLHINFEMIKIDNLREKKISFPSKICIEIFDISIPSISREHVEG